MENNEPHQKYMDNGYFITIEESYNTPYGIKLCPTIKVTGLGQVKILQRIKHAINS